MTNLFNAQMTSDEARIILFNAVEGKSKEEIEKIKNEYTKILPEIIDREIELASKGWVF